MRQQWVGNDSLLIYYFSNWKRAEKLMPLLFRLNSFAFFFLDVLFNAEQKLK